MRFVLTILWLRWCLLRGAMRRSGNVLQALGSILFALLGLGLAVGMALAVKALISGSLEAEQFSTARGIAIAAFCGCVFLGFLLPLFLHGGVGGVDVSRLRQFPVGRGPLYLVVLASSLFAVEHLFYYPILASLFVTGAKFPDASRGLAAGGIALFLLVLVTWSHAASLLAQRLMSGRRTREVFVLLALVVLVGVSFVPLALDGYIDDPDSPALRAMFDDLAAALAWTPPGLAGDLLVDSEGALLRASLLGLWAVPGVLAGYFLFSRLHEGDRGAATASTAKKPAKSGARGGEGLEGLLLNVLPAPVVAVSTKEWRYLLRSPVGRFLLIILPGLFFFLGSGVLADVEQSILGIDPRSTMLYGMLLYIPLSLNVFVHNAFAWESRGVQSYFLAPVSLHAMLFGKNLALFAYAGTLAAMCTTVFALTVAPPSLFTLLNAFLLYLSALLSFAIAGNLTSVLFPAPRAVSSLRNTLPGASMLASLATILVIGITSAICVFVPPAVEMIWLQPVFLAVLIAVLAFSYYSSLRVAAQWMADRRETLIHRLRPVD